jgi:Mrp family chromosome partitioning ATPase
VDGDFRRSSLGRMLNLPDSPGLAEVLRGEARYEEVVRRTPIPNLFFIPAGSMENRSAAELFTTKAARQTFARMRNEFHYTIVDTPPATTVSDAGIVGQMCNGVIVLVRMNRTHEALAKRAVKLLQTNNVPILGCLAIGREAATGGFGYGYGYYYNRYYYEYHRKNPSKR